MIRHGQALMNELYRVDPRVYELLLGSQWDCYYDDRNIENTLSKLKEVWMQEGKNK
jgi:hypothetical protein